MVCNIGKINGLDKSTAGNMVFALCGQKEFYWVLGRKKSLLYFD
jgi:hypothetical protein